MTRGKETACIKKLNDSIFAAGGYAWKIPDPVPVPGGHKTVKRPYDVFGHFHGRFFAYEAKYLSSYSAFGQNRLEDHQHESLQSVLDTGGLAYVVLFVNSHNQYRLFQWPYEVFKGLGTIRHRTLLELPYLSNTKGGYPVDWLEAACSGK